MKRKTHGACSFTWALHCKNSKSGFSFPFIAVLLLPLITERKSRDDSVLFTSKLISSSQGMEVLCTVHT